MADLLMLTPLMPFPSGQGSAMRASVALEVLAERHRVYVVDTNVWGARKLPDTWVQKHAAGYSSFPVVADPGAPAELLKNTFPHCNFAGLYVFRLILAPLAIQLQSVLGEPLRRMVLDLDDNEVERAQRILPLREEAGEYERAALERRELDRVFLYTKVFIPRFDVTLLASERDRAYFETILPERRFLQLPNIVHPPTSLERDPKPGRILFVGGLDYLPNEDGIVHFCLTALPLLRASGAGCTVRVAGAGASARVLDLARFSDIQLLGFVPELAPEYASAQIAIVPLRAGSGTRIKILEAISYRCPVVSTHAGAEGLGLRHEVECLLADTPQDFAAACRRLLSDPALRLRLSRQAFEWLERTHSVDRVRSVLHPLFDGSAPGPES